MEALKSIIDVDTNTSVAIDPFLERKIRLNILTNVHKKFDAMLFDESANFEQKSK